VPDQRERPNPPDARIGPRRLEALRRLTDAALAYLTEDELLAELLVRISEVLDVDTVAILLADGDELRARAARGIEEEVERGVRIPIGRGFAGRIAAERRPIAIADVDHADVLNPILREKGIRSLLGVPLLVEGRAIGVLHVGSLTPRLFSGEETELLQLAGDRAALAIEQARLYEQRRVAELLQRRLLPGEIRDTAGLQVAGRYLPAAGASLGGDWYDVFPLPGGRVALAVGDVVGHGIAAAAVMAQLRTALRAYASEGHPPETVVDLVNQLMWNLGPDAMTTLVYLVLDAAGESLELVSAGHPPPLRIDASGATFLEGRGGTALGASATAVYRSETFALPTGAIVLGYTDGLVEVRGESLDVGLERLRGLATGFTDVEALCTALVERLVSDAPADDVAFIAARVPPLSDHMVTRWPAESASLANVRHLLRRWLRRAGAGDDELYDMVVACQEACANAVEHAYAPGPAAFELELLAMGGRIRLTIRDHGRWRAPRGENRGRGLPMMRALMDSVEIRQTGDGTEVSLERSLAGVTA
jgi:anti-sigma regulatory factor (Ser/Thr protein kinase)/putative methionine-R-sulfoxide reductase with GAF domain